MRAASNMKTASLRRVKVRHYWVSISEKSGYFLCGNARLFRKISNIVIINVGHGPWKDERRMCSFCLRKLEAMQ